MRRLEKINRGGRQGIVGKQPLRNILESLPKYYIPVYYKYLMARRKKSRRRKAMIHPSLTALAGTALIADFINEGYGASGKVSTNLLAGNFSNALRLLGVYLPALVTTPKGQQALIKGVGVSVIGAGLRKVVPNVKLGLGRYYARI